VTGLENDFWSQVFGGATDGEVIAVELLSGEAEVSELEIALAIEEDVFGFETE
jgi:hypothetical protein